MTGLEPLPRDALRSPTSDATAAVPHIVNGLTIRPRKQVNLWQYGLLLLPDFAGLLILVGLGTHRLLQYLGTKGQKES
jgi:hypothetical protein